MSLIEITDKSQLKQIQNKIKKIVLSQLSVRSKAKVADQLYIIIDFFFE
jgi:hypothetical protein